MDMRDKIKAMMVADSTVASMLGTPIRLFALHAPQGIAEPYAIVEMPSHLVVNTLQFMNILENVRMSFHMYGTSYTALVLLKDWLEFLMDAAGHIYIFGTEVFEDDTEMYHLIFDFSVWNYRDQ